MLKANQQEIQLGTLVKDKEHRFKYTLVNTGKEVILVNSITIGCQSCTKASMNTNRIEPGEDTNVDVVFTPDNTGLFTKTITVDYNVGTDKHDLKLTFRASVDG